MTRHAAGIDGSDRRHACRARPARAQPAVAPHSEGDHAFSACRGWLVDQVTAGLVARLGA